jgi:drug/metabolite transporter (DMT)-like permease
MSNQVKGALYLAGAMVMFSLMSTMVKLVSPQVSAVQSVFARGLIGTVIIYIYAKQRNISLRGNNRRLLFLRAILGTIALIMVFYAFTKIPTANAMLLNQMTPVFMVPLSIFFLKEKIFWQHMVLILLAFVGVGIVLRPGTVAFNVYGLLALFSAFFAALAYLSIRLLKKTEDSITIVFWFVLISTVSVIPMSLYSMPILNPVIILQLLVMGLLGTVGQFFLTTGYGLGQPGRLAVIGSTGAVFCVLWDYLFFDIWPDLYSVLGGLLIITCCVWVQLLQVKDPKHKI